MATCIVVPSDAALVRVTSDDVSDAMWSVDLEQDGAALFGDVFFGDNLYCCVVTQR